MLLSDIRKIGVEYNRERMQPYAKIIGELAIEWNGLHVELAKMFALVINAENGETGFRIWYQLRSDLSQREILRAAIESRYAKDEPVYERLHELLNKINKFAHRRNAAIHVPIGLANKPSGALAACRT